MSESGFTGLPPRTGISDSGYPPSRADLKAQIIEMRGEIRAEKTRQRMEGEIVRHDKNGQSRIRTDKGDVTVRFQTRNPPPEGTRVQIELPPEKAAGKQAQATIQVATSDNRSPQPAATPPAASSQPLPAQKTNTAGRPAPLPLAPDTAKSASEPVMPYNPARPAAAAPLQAESLVRLLPYSGTVLPAQTAAPPDIIRTILSPLFMQTLPATVANKNALTSSFGQSPAQNFLTGQNILTPPPPLAPVSQGTIIPFRTETSLPVFNAGPEIIIAAPQNTGAPTALTNATESSAEKEPPALMDIRIKSMTASITQTGKEAAAEKIVTNAKAGENIAVVSGRTPEGLPVLSLLSSAGHSNLSGGLFVLQFNASNLPGGTIISFAPENIVTAPPRAAASPATAPAAVSTTAPVPVSSSYALPLPLPAQHWPAFEDMVSTLRQVSPQVAQNTGNIMPSPANPASMAPAILFFVAAMRGGDIQNWLGEKALDALRRSGKAEILTRLTREVSGLARTAAEPATQDWRMLAFPLYWNGDIQKLPLYYRHDRPPEKEDENDTKKRGTRFIFDLDLNRMGTVQLDGLHRPVAEDAQNGRLDLILRTIRPVSTLMQQKMRQTYYNALTQAGVHGELQFQGTAERFVKINAATPRHESLI